VRIGFKTTIEEDLISPLKIKAIQEKVDVNDILEALIFKYLNGDIQIEINSKNSTK
jgi:hypothetical protein